MSDVPFLEEIFRVARGVALAVLPLAALFAVFQILFLRLPRPEIMRIVTGTLMASVGLFLFLLGAGVAFMPFGRLIGETFGAMSQTWLLLIFGAVLGFVTTWGEPAVRILAAQVEQASTGAIRHGVVLVFRVPRGQVCTRAQRPITRPTSPYPIPDSAFSTRESVPIV